MKADASDAGREALLWAIDYFRNGGRLTPRTQKEKRQEEEEWRSLVIRRYDACRHDEPIADLVSALTSTGGIKALEQGRQEQGIRALRGYVVSMLEQGERLPQSLADFAAAFLRDPRDFTKARGRKRDPNKFRLDMLMVMTMLEIIETWGLKPTRNVATDKTCAASVVKAALKTAWGISVSESRIAAAWKDNHIFFEAYRQHKLEMYRQISRASISRADPP